MLIPLKTALAMQHIPYKRARLYKCTSWACAKLFHVCYFFITMLLEKYNVLIDLMFFQIIKVLFEYFSIFSGKLNKVLH